MFRAFLLQLVLEIMNNTMAIVYKQIIFFIKFDLFYGMGGVV
jgi:hypothetical protein